MGVVFLRCNKCGKIHAVGNMTSNDKHQCKCESILNWWDNYVGECDNVPLYPNIPAKEKLSHEEYMDEDSGTKNGHEKQNGEMITRKTWKEFRESGFLWWINMILHTFGWAVVVEDDGTVIDCYPARVRYRGFDELHNSTGYTMVSQYMKNNAEELLIESKE